MKKISVLLLALFVAGCGATLDTSSFTAEQKLENAKKLYNDEDYFDALQELKAIVFEYPGSFVVDDASYYLAQTRYKRGEYILAAFGFSKLIKNMPASEYVPISQFMLAQSYYELSPDYRLDQKYTKKAIEEFQAFIDFFPSNEKVKEAETKITELNNKLALKLFHSAQIYEKLEYYGSAIDYYSELIEVYHETKYAPKAMYNKISLLIDREKYKEAYAETKIFISRYPNDENISDVKQMQSSLKNEYSSLDND